MTEFFTKNEQPRRAASERTIGILGGGRGPLTDNVVLRTFSVFLFLSVERCLMQDPVQRHHGMTFAGALQLLLLFFSADGPTKDQGRLLTAQSVQRLLKFLFAVFISRS